MGKRGREGEKDKGKERVRERAERRGGRGGIGQIETERTVGKKIH